MQSTLEAAAAQKLAEMQAYVDDTDTAPLSLFDALGMPDAAVAEIKKNRGVRSRGKHRFEIATLIRSHVGDVLLHQVVIAVMPLADLIALGLTPHEAVAEKRLSAAVVLPYLERRQPISVDVTARQAIYLTLETVAGVVGVAIDGTLAAPDAPPVPLYVHDGPVVPPMPRGMRQELERAGGVVPREGSRVAEDEAARAAAWVQANVPDLPDVEYNGDRVGDSPHGDR